MKRLFSKSRLAICGLVLVLIVLMGCSLGSINIIWNVSRETDDAVQMNDLYQRAYYLARAEDSIADGYSDNSGVAAQKEYFTDAHDLTVLLHAINSQGNEQDRAFVQPLYKTQILYTLHAGRYFQLVDIQDKGAQAFYEKYMHPFIMLHIIPPLQLAANAQHVYALQSLTRLKMTEQAVIISLALIFVLCIILFILCGVVIRQYQQRLDQARQKEKEQMEHLAHTDPLTGLPNHRAVIEHLKITLATNPHLPQTCALMFIDLDHFKQINDRWGHQVGDAVLREAGVRFVYLLRPEDVVGRYGGEEFIIVLPQTDLAQAEVLAEQLRATFADQPCLLPVEGDTTRLNELFVTVSVGIASTEQSGSTVIDLLAAADRAMYQAKHNGRNRVCVASESFLKMKDMLTEAESQPLTESIVASTLTIATNLCNGANNAHARRMATLAVATAERLQCSLEEYHQIQLAAILHDIGKIGIPDTILNKPGPLTNDEWNVIRQYPLLGQHMLEQIGENIEQIACIVVAHHERWDGCGYPYGLSQQEIPLGARIIAVVNAYDAMTELCAYRQPLSVEEAKEELRSNANRQFDPYVVEAFLEELAAREETIGEYQPHARVLSQEVSSAG